MTALLLIVSPAQADTNSNKDYARSYMKTTYGWGTKQYKCLENLWVRESGWNHASRNRRSGAYGIPQALPASKMKSAGNDWRTNPHTQIKWGLSYIVGRYKTPCGAWNHFKKKHWY
jgi:hypothetical protein